MKLTRYLKPAQIRMELRTRTPAEIPEGWSRERFAWSVKEEVLRELVELIEASGKVANPKKLFTDLLNRERKATTGIGEGLAVPHVRTMQAKDLVLFLARSTPGVEFMSLDDRPVHLFIGVVAPPYDDALYLQLYKRIAQAFSSPGARERLMAAKDDHETIKILSDVQGWDSAQG
jgi:PTS system fructose-specific IIC component